MSRSRPNAASDAWLCGARVRTEPLTPEELARARSQIEASFAFGKDSTTDQAEQLGYWASVFDWRYLSTYLDRIRAQTPADLLRVAKKYFVADDRTAGQFL